MTPDRHINRSPIATAQRAARRRAVTVLETLVAMTIFLVGIVAIIHYYPSTIRQLTESAHLRQATMLAQMKAEEIRRDNDQMSNLMNEIRILSTPTDPIPFQVNPILSYSFNGESLIDPSDSPGTPRVIIRYSSDYRPSQNVIYELKFQE